MRRTNGCLKDAEEEAGGDETIEVMGTRSASDNYAPHEYVEKY